MTAHNRDDATGPYDVIVAGGGAAGLSAALMLGRARRRTLVLDAGEPRNAPSPASHGVFTRDGAPPAELLREARAQLGPYATVTLCDVAAAGARPVEGGFEVDLSSGGRAYARRLLLAVGVRDELPAIEGLAGLWGTRVLHCPYCHGWEVRDQPLAVHLADRSSVPLMTLLPGWTHDLLVCAEPAAGLSGEERDLLAARGVAIVEAPLTRVAAWNDGLTLEFADGRIESRRALFLRPPHVVRGPLPSRLGCELTEAGYLRIGQDHQTSIPGVYAAGDAAGPLHQVLTAAASGQQAAMALNRDLAEADFRGAGAVS
jgi:thioredoxin reductase